MQFKTLTDSQLIDSTKNAVGIETRATINVVRHFREIFDRGLHLKRGYSSMFLMATKEFGYHKAAAQRRVKAMELSIAVPSVLDRIDSGELGLQSAADIQTFLDQERGAKRPYSANQTVELVEFCSGKSSGKIEIELASRNPDFEFKESMRFVSKDRVRVTYTSSIAIDPVRKAERAEKRKLAKVQVPAPELVEHPQFDEEVVSEGGEIQLVACFESRSRYIAAEDAHDVQRENEGRGCDYVDLETVMRCGSIHQLQIDHIVEYSSGGSNSAENLRLLCSQHNRWRWRNRVREPSFLYAV